MPVPSSISDLSTTPALNSPPGSESPSSIDDYLRAHAAFIKQVSDSKADTSAVAALNGSVAALNDSVVALNGSKADKSEVVKLAGPQTVDDVKTFTSSPIVPNPATGTRSQAVATMQKFADEFGASLAASGYQRLPSGFIIQWGTFAIPAGAGSATLTFPISFPNSCRSLIMNTFGPSGGSMPLVVSVASASAQVDETGGSGLTVIWIAVGN